MGFTALNATDLETGKRITEGLLTNIKNDLDYLYGNIIDVSESGGVIRNGGFEIDADVNGQPDNWDINLYTGGGSTLVTTATTWASPIHGNKTLCFTRPAGVGNGAGYAISDYFPISSQSNITLDMLLWADTSAVNNSAGIYLYDADKTYTTYIAPYFSTNESTAARRVVVSVNPRGHTANYARMMIKCGATAMGSSAHIYVDDVHGSDRCEQTVYRTVSTVNSMHSTHQYYPSEEKQATAIDLELPYSTGLLMVDLRCRWLVNFTKSSGATAGYSSVAIPMSVGIALGEGTTAKTNYSLVASASSACYINFNETLVISGTGKHSLDVYIACFRGSTLNDGKLQWPSTAVISLVDNRISYSIVNPNL